MEFTILYTMIRIGVGDQNTQEVMQDEIHCLKNIFSTTSVPGISKYFLRSRQEERKVISQPVTKQKFNSIFLIFFPSITVPATGITPPHLCK